MTLAMLAGCGNKKRDLAGIGAGTLGPGHAPNACVPIQDGCPCDTEGETSDCGSVKSKVDGIVTCAIGTRTCSNGTWGECVVDHEEKKPVSYRAPMQGGFTPQGLGSAASCNDLCNPECQQIDDDATGLTVPPDLYAGPDGVTLPSGSSGGSCDNVTVSPPTSTITVTAIAADGSITATPNSGKVDFDATCSGGTSVEPSWTIDSYDRAVISSHGVVTVYSGVGGPIKVTGSTATDSDTGTLNVNVKVGDTRIAAGTTAEVGKTLYPYNGTVFPLGLKAPLVQWTEGGITPTKTQVILCYPKDTCTTFQYAKTYPTSAQPTIKEPRDGTLDATVPAWQIPQEIWSTFDRTAAGGTGQIIIQRQTSGTTYKQMAIDVQFASDALRGTVYYTQYLRTLHTSNSTQTFTYSGSSYTPGQTCEVGNNTHPSSTGGSQTRAIDLSTSAATNIDPFAKGGYTAGCPVCHSVSADGSTVVSGGQNWQTSGGGNGLGIDAIGVDSTGAPAFTGLFAAPNYSVASTNGSESSGEDSRGYSYAAITPDGSIVLQGPTFWGNTVGTPTANNTQDATLTGIAGAAKPYFFADTDNPTPGVGVQFATTGQLPTYTVSGTGSSYTLTGTGTLTVDGISMGSTAYSVLVKDEVGANAKNNGVYTVSQTNPWKLKLRSDTSATGAFKSGSTVRVSDGNTNRGNTYYISSPTSGTITPGSTSLTFALIGYPPMVMGSATPRTVDYATTGPLLPATVTQVGNVLTGGYASSLVVDGHTMALNETVLVQDQVNAVQNGTYKVTALGVGGTGAPIAVGYATTAALPANTNASGVLTGTALGSLPAIDGITPALNDTILVKDEGTPANNGVYTVTTVGVKGSGTPLSTVRVATVAALPANSNTAGVLTPTSYGSLGSIDGVAVAVNDRVLVKNEGATANNGVFIVTALGTGTTNTHSAANFGTTAALPAYTSNTGVLTATNYGILGPIDGQAVAAGNRVLVMNEGTAANNGIYTVTSAGTGTSTTHAAVKAATAAALPANSYAAGVLTASGYGALTVDGITGFGAGDRLLLQDEATAANDGIYTVTGGGTGTTTSLATAVKIVATAALPANTFSSSANTLTKNNPAAAFPVIDGVTLVAGDRILVAGESNNVTNGVYTLTTVGNGTTPWKLTRATDANSAGELTGGMQIAITNGTTNGGKTFYMSTPGNGTAVTVNTTGMNFSLSVKWSLTRAADADGAGDFTGGDQVPVNTGGTANGGKQFYISTPGNGTAVTIGTTAIAFSLSSKWVLTRATDGDTTGEITAGDQFPVTAGTANGTKTFYVSTPSSGSPTINSGSIGFSLSSKWGLARATDADSSAKVFPGLQVPVSAGSTNAGDTFYISTPASGTITLNSTGIAFSQAISWELTRKSPYDTAGGGLVPGLQATASGGTTQAGKTFYVSSPTSGTITVNTTPIVWSGGSSWQLTRTTDADATGEITPGMEVKVSNGAANASRVFYVSSPTSGTISINSTNIGFSYGLPSMMAPVISPDGTKVAYVNGDPDVGGGFPETGWRRGLSMFSFNQATLAVSNKKRLINNWNASTPGTPVKWPFFEGDSRSLLYVETDPNEFCSSGANNGTCSSVGTDTYALASCTSSGSTAVNSNLERACYQAAYGSMSPTTRGFWPGRIFSIDTSAATPSSTRVEFSKLNDAEDSTDADKAYQPTVLPFTAGGKRWVIFTSPRSYGNQFNMKSSAGTPTDLSCAASMLWVSAVDNAPANGTDRSHPAFFMPGQAVSRINTGSCSVNSDCPSGKCVSGLCVSYVNERGYLVPSPCKSAGLSCSVDEECCGASDTPATAACRAPAGWDPATGPPAKKCEGLSGTCHNSGQSCATSDDCCNGASCVNFACAAGGHYEAATLTREYVAECPVGELPRWTTFSFHLTTDADSSITFTAQTSDDLDQLDGAKVVALGSSTADVKKPANPVQIDVGAALDSGNISKNFTNLRILMKLNPSTDGLSAPVLHDWEMRYTCEPGL
jgi:hypothetical protein